MLRRPGGREDEAVIDRSTANGLGQVDLTSESVERASLTLERVDDIHGGDGLAASMLGVGHGISDDVLQEHLKDTSGLLIDQTRDSLHTSSASQSADSRLGDALDVVSQDLSVSLGSALS